MHKSFLPLFLISWSFLLSAQKVDTEDLEVATERGDSAYIFDYRLHRNPALILKELREQKGDSVELAHLYRGNVIYRTNDSSRFDIDLNPQKVIPYKLDFQIRPYYYAEYGQFDRPVQTQIGISPRLQIDFFKGFYGVFQWMIPLQNDFKIRTGYETRPGELGIGYTHIWDQRYFFNVFAGTFINDRYGIYAEYIWSDASGRFYTGVSGYYTGRYLYDFSEQTLFRDFINYPSGHIFFAYRFVKHDLTVRVMAERFLRDDEGFTFELFRQFGSTDIGFFASRSTRGDNAGFYITFALWPRKFVAAKKAQFRLPHSFRLNYNLRPNTGISEITRPYTDFFYDIYRFNRHFIENQD